MGSTIIFCLPGNNFSGAFLRGWSENLNFCLRNNITPIISQCYSPNVYFVRNLCLGGDVSRGKDQKPFNGKVAYDFLMWIDSDILFKPEQLVRLLNDDADIVSGLYFMENGKQFATVKEWDEDYFSRKGYFRFLMPSDIQGANGLLEVAFTGMGFMLVKKGVFEALEYPLINDNYI